VAGTLYNCSSYTRQSKASHREGTYTPTWVEFAITAGCFAAFILLYVLFAKIFPIVSIWEIKEGKKIGVEETVARVKSYLPESISNE